MISQREPLDETPIKRIEEIVQRYLKVPIKVEFAKYCNVCADGKKPIMWIGMRITHIDTMVFDRLPDDYLAFMVGHEFGHARYTFPMNCDKANDHSENLLRTAGVPDSEVKRLLQRWVDDANALEKGKTPSWT